MDIHTIRMMLKTHSIYDIPLRVTYYARVSSESDEQLNSLGNQIAYYEDLIRKNLTWTFVPGYIDEGLSGISTKKRENFNRMIDDAAMDKFDLVITKEISRFARNTLDSIQFTRQLLGYGVGVFFQNDNINTFDEDSELRLSIMSSIAQDELRKLSSRVKFGHQQAIKSNVGIEGKLFNNKIDFVVDIFHDQRNGIFQQRVQVPEFVGVVSNPYANVGKMKSYGADGNISFTQDFTPDFGFTLRGNFTYSKNKVQNWEQAYLEYPYLEYNNFPYNSIQGDLGAGCPDGGEDYFRGGCKDQGTEWG